MIAVDASVLIAQLSPSDAHHEASTEVLLAAVDEDLVTHEITLAEVLVGGVRFGRGQEMSADIRAVGVHAAEGAHGEPLRLAELRVRTGLKLPDCCILDTAIIHNAALATFDPRLGTAARDLGIAVLP